MDEGQSIDGLGLTIDDLSESGWRKALVAIMHRTEQAAAEAKLDNDTRAAIKKHLTSGNKKLDDAEQKIIEALKAQS